MISTHQDCGRFGRKIHRAYRFFRPGHWQAGVAGKWGNNTCTIRKCGEILLLLICMMSAGCATVESFFGDGEQTTGEIRNDLGRAVEYQVKFTGAGAEQKKLLDTMRRTSSCLRLQNRPPPTIAGIRRRAEEDVDQFEAILHSFGYYDGRVSYRLTEETSGREPDAPASKASLEFQIEPGGPYRLSEIELEIHHQDETVQRPINDAELKATGLSFGMRAEAAPIIDAEQRLIDLFLNSGYPLAESEKRRVTADTKEKTLKVVYRIITGRKADFGEVVVSGAKKVDPGFISGYRSWQKGKSFSSEQLKMTQQDLAKTNLFNSVIIHPAKAINDQGQIPIEIQVTEREPRTVGGGVNYSTADGFGANLSWEHRNLFGSGEKLKFLIDGSGLQQGAEASFRKPQFLKRRQDLIIDAHGKEFNSDAYEGELADTFAGIERRFGQHWSATAGVIAEYSNLTGAESPNENFYLGGLRGLVRLDSTNNPLDPTAGSRLEISLSPFTSLAGTSSQFVIASLHGSKYFSFDEAGRYVLAGRGQLSSVWGEERSALPSNKRFYSGGGGSVRGYAYQKIGPLDANNDPLGGRSVVEAGLEFRARLTETIGLVPFIEGGNVFEKTYPDSFDLLWAAGLGLRYYTAIGPIRLDLALPLDKRENVDDNYQVYISIGQAF